MKILLRTCNKLIKIHVNNIKMTKQKIITIDIIQRSTYKTFLKHFAKFWINTFIKIQFKDNLKIKQTIKVIQISPKINVKTILIEKSIVLSPESQKTIETIVSFGSKILRFCLKIKTFTQMLKKKPFLQKQKNDNSI